MRVILAGMTARLRDIVADALGGDPTTVLSWCTLGELERGRGTDCDVLVAGFDDPDDDAYARRLLDTAPRARVLLIATRGDRAALYELRPQKRVLAEVSPGDLVTAIRGTLQT